ncbi:hypothetical protein K501DRAFT_332044 [Backusella circina FSU 941]|nr:hypothetical protein K501DRAFT_332044 [Backusella circina FSU 941]
MAFNSLLKNIIAKTVQEYKETAGIDPEKFESGDTYIDEQLDLVLDAQEKQKRELWTQYYKMKEQMKENEKDKVFEERTDKDTQLALGLMKQTEMLSEEILRQTEQKDVVTPVREIEARLAFKDELQKQVTSLSMTLKHVKKEREELEERIKSEECHLKIAKEMHNRLKPITYFDNEADAIRERIRKVEECFHAETNALIDFLNKYYPSTKIEEVPNSLEYQLTMLDIVEDLMNTSNQEPNDPYIEMVPGTYWPPHLQTLIKAHIAVYHPDDPTKIKLSDYSL